MQNMNMAAGTPRCPRCGLNVRPTDKFCQKCGTNLMGGSIATYAPDDFDDTPKTTPLFYTEPTPILRPTAGAMAGGPKPAPVTPAPVSSAPIRPNPVAPVTPSAPTGGVAPIDPVTVEFTDDYKTVIATSSDAVIPGRIVEPVPEKVVVPPPATKRDEYVDPVIESKPVAEDESRKPLKGGLVDNTSDSSFSAMEALGFSSAGDL